MPNNISFFAKNESSYSISDNTVGNYCGVGCKHASKDGIYEGMLALKANKSTLGCFGEFKYTSPKSHNLALESRTRIQIENSENSATSRLALKYSKNLSNKFNIYEIAGATGKYSISNNEMQKITPLSLTGISYNFNNKFCAYGEGELSKSYDIKDNSWGSITPCFYFGLKYTL